MRQNLNIEAEGSELILKNKAGDYVIIPKKYRTEVQGMIKDNCHSCIDNLVETLPTMADYAEDGSLYSEYLANDSLVKKSTKHPLDPNPDGSLPSYFKGSKENPIQLDEVVVTAKAPTYIKYRRNWEKENPFDIDKYVEDRFNNPIGREAISRINEKAWREHLRQEGLKKRQSELDEATKMGLLYQRFNPQDKDDIPIADEQFSKRYGTSPHRYRYDNDPEYRKYYENVGRNATSTIDYPSTDLRRKDVVAPNNMWMHPNLTGESQKAMTDFSNEVIGAALPIPGLEAMGKIPSVFKAGKNLIKTVDKATDAIKPVSKVLNKIDDDIIRKANASERFLNIKPENYYRVIGNEEGYKDLITSRIIRPNQSGMFKGRSTFYTKGAVNDARNPVIGGGAKKGTIYEGDYIVEVSPNDKYFPTDKHRLNKDWNFGLTKSGNEIPYDSEFVNVYKYNKKLKKYEIVPKVQSKQ